MPLFALPECLFHPLALVFTSKTLQGKIDVICHGYQEPDHIQNGFVM